MRGGMEDYKGPTEGGTDHCYGGYLPLGMSNLGCRRGGGLMYCIMRGGL